LCGSRESEITAGRPRMEAFVGLASYLEPLLANGLVGTEFAGRALEYDTTVPHDIDAMRNPERDRQLLLNQQDGDASLRDMRNQITDLLHDQRCQPFCRLVDHDEFRIAYQRAAGGEHLFLAAGQHTGRRIGARSEVGEHVEHVLQPPLAGTTGILDAQQQILTHREAGKNVSVLGDVAQPEACDPVARQAGDVLPLEADGAVRRHLAHDRLDGGGAADAVASQQAHHLAGTDVQINALQNVALAVIGVKILDLQHQ